MTPEGAAPLARRVTCPACRDTYVPDNGMEVTVDGVTYCCDVCASPFTPASWQKGHPGEDVCGDCQVCPECENSWVPSGCKVCLGDGYVHVKAKPAKASGTAGDEHV